MVFVTSVYWFTYGFCEHHSTFTLLAFFSHHLASADVIRLQDSTVTLMTEKHIIVLGFTTLHCKNKECDKKTKNKKVSM